MKIEKINLDESITSQLGLKPVQMDRLNHVVLVAGKNGSGKSRLLQLIKEQVNAAPNSKTLDELNKNIKQFKFHVSQEETNIRNLSSDLAKGVLNKEQIDSLNNSKKNSENNIVNYKGNIDSWQKQVDSANSFTFFPEKQDKALIDFVPQSLTLRDSYTISPQELDNYAKHIYTIGTNSISEGTIPAIEKIQKNWVNANTVTIDDLNITKEEKEKIFAEYEKLKKYI